MALDVPTSGKIGLRDLLRLRKCQGQNTCWDMMWRGKDSAARLKVSPNFSAGLSAPVPVEGW